MREKRGAAENPPPFAVSCAFLFLEGKGVWEKLTWGGGFVPRPEI
jgi:hypothetical protein